MLAQILALIKKDLTLEWRQKYAFGGILLYVGGAIFICYLCIGVRTSQLSPSTWNAIFWIIMLFISINAVSKSFFQERQQRFIYYYTIANPQAFIISKIIYNAVLMIFLGIIAFAFYALVMENKVEDNLLFIINILLASLSFASALTMISAIAAKAGNNATLMAILGFPVILPLLLLIIKISKAAMDGLDRSLSIDEIAIVLSINVIIITVTYLLFPYLWRS